MSDGGRLRGRTAVVTGAGGGIGRGIALALAAEGANVVIAARRLLTGEQTAAMIRAEQGEALALQCDVAEQQQVAATIAAAVAAYGALDIVVHNANASDSAMPIALEAVTDENWQAQAAVAWDAAFFLAQAAHLHLKESGRGRFIVLGSCFGLHGAAMNPIYAALKGGDRGLVKALAREWGADGITVNAVEPAAATEPTEVFFISTRKCVPSISAIFRWLAWGGPAKTSVAPSPHCAATTSVSSPPRAFRWTAGCIRHFRTCAPGPRRTRGRNHEQTCRQDRNRHGGGLGNRRRNRQSGGRTGGQSRRGGYQCGGRRTPRRGAARARI